jgi:replicative DNA helicase
MRKIVRRKPEAPKSSLDELGRYVKFVTIQTAMEEAAKQLEKEETDKAYKALTKIIRIDSKPKIHTIVKWIEEFGARQEMRRHRREHPEEYRFIPTGFKKLDMITGGIQPGELGIVMAMTGVGKSIGLTNICYSALKAKNSVAYFNLEMGAAQVASRLDARWLGMSYRMMKHYGFTPEELRAIDKKLEHAAKVFKAKLRIISLPVRSCTTETLLHILEDMKDEEGFDPDMVIVDSADHMKSVTKYDQLRIEQAEIYWMLKGFAEEYTKAVWSSTQAGRNAKGRRVVAEDTSEAYDKARIADLIITLNEPEETTRSTRESDVDGGGGESEVVEKRMADGAKRLELYLAKYRDGESKITIQLEADLDRMFIHDLEDPDMEKSE